MVISDDNKNQQKPFIAHTHMLLERLHFFIHNLHPLLRADVVYALEQRGKLLHTSADIATSSRPSGMWALLPLLIIRDLSPEVNVVEACSVAISTECLICALDLLDDVEDEDQTPTVQHLGIARTLNVSTTLLLLAQQTLLSLQQLGTSPEQVTKLLTLLQERTLIAATGQHEDLMSESQPLTYFTQEDCIRIAGGKAGSLLRLACTIGCIFTGLDEETTQLFAEMGELLGIAHQLDNDSHDLHTLLHGETHEQIKTDLQRQKKTLPFVLASQLQSGNQASHDTPPQLFSPGKQAERQKLFLQALDEGIITTWGISLLYRERAHECLRKIEISHPLSHELHLLLGFA